MNDIINSSKSSNPLLEGGSNKKTATEIAMNIDYNRGYQDGLKKAVEIVKSYIGKPTKTYAIHPVSYEDVAATISTALELRLRRGDD